MKGEGPEKKAKAYTRKTWSLIKTPTSVFHDPKYCPFTR
jgi:hypothetical protein